MKLYYCGKSTDTMYGSSTLPVLAIVEYPENIVGDVFAELEAEGVLGNLGCLNMVVIDLTGEVPAVREKVEAELVVDAEIAANDELDVLTRDAIYSVADFDKQNSLSLMYNNMSTTDKSRAKTYFDWHKRMLASHYDLKTALINAQTLAEIDTIRASFVPTFDVVMLDAPYDAVDLRSYIH